MLTFLTDDDIRTNIRNIFFDSITDTDQEVIDKAESSAIAKMKSKLAGRYDVEAIFTATLGSRDELILEYCLAIFLYRLHCRINPRKVPESIKEHYKEAVKWLDNVMNGKENPVLPVLPNDELGVGDVRWGGTQTAKDNFY